MSENLDFLDKDIVKIYTDEGGVKYIKFLGYAYLTESPETDEKPYRIVEYGFFILSLERALRLGIGIVSNEVSCDYKQYIYEANFDEVKLFCNSCQNSGFLTIDMLNMDTPDGVYILE